MLGVFEGRVYFFVCLVRGIVVMCRVFGRVGYVVYIFTLGR